MKDGDSRNHDEVAVFSLLRSGLEALELETPSGRIQQLVDLVLLLDQWAAKINLTGHRSPEEMASRLVLDAAALARALPELASARTLADLGTGAGFPGLPLAILHPHLEVLLVDSRLKRNHFQREARRRLQLSNVRPILGRSEEVERVPCDVVVAQAMAQPRLALGLMAQWAHAGSILVLPASDASEEPDPPLGVGRPSLREYRVPSTGTPRKLWVAPIEAIEATQPD